MIAAIDRRKVPNPSKMDHSELYSRIHTSVTARFTHVLFV